MICSRKSKLDFDSDSSVKHDKEMAKKILNLVSSEFDGVLKNLDENLKKSLDENKFVEGKMLEKKDEKEFPEKSKDNDILDANLKKIAGILSTELNKEDLNKLINLLEDK